MTTNRSGTADSEALLRPLHRLLALGWTAVSALLCGIAGIALSSCSDGYERPGRVFLIGIDGASPRIIDELIAEGRLENLGRLKREGASGTLRSSKPISSPRIWNTIATGKVPEKHGILHFSRKGEDGSHHLFLSNDRKVHAIWNIASDAGLEVGVVNFWNTYPPEEINGVMVSDHLLAQEIAGRELMVGADATPGGSLIHPDSWHSKLAPLAGDKTLLTSLDNPFREEVVLPSFTRRDELTRHFYEDAALTRIALAIDRELKPDLLMVLLPGIDRVSHFLWGMVEPEAIYPEPLRPTPSERAGGRKALLEYYEYADELIGLLLDRLTSKDLVMVVSDHGFEAGHAFTILTGTHESEKAIAGVIFARGPGVTAGASIEGVSIDDITPTLLAWMGLPVAEDMDGHVATFLDVPEPDRVATHDRGAVRRIATAPSGVEDEIVDQLRTLGYIEEETPPPNSSGDQ